MKEKDYKVGNRDSRRSECKLCPAALGVPLRVNKGRALRGPKEGVIS